MIHRQEAIAVSALVGTMVFAYRHFVADDALIALRCARHWIEAGSPAFNLGEPVNALSSPLWFLTGSSLYSLTARFGPDGPVMAQRVASGACTWMACALFIGLARRAVHHVEARRVAIVLFLADPWLWRWGFSGMEAPLAVLVVIGGLFLTASVDPRSRVIAPFLVTGIGTLVRPELALLGLTLAVRLFLIDVEAAALLRKTRWRLAIAVSAIPLLAWVRFAASHFETVVPQTALAKRGLLTAPEAAGYALGVLVSSQAIAGLLIAAAAVAWLVGRRHAEPPAGARDGGMYLLFWPALLYSFYILQGYIPVSRYLLMAAPAWVIAGARAFEWLCKWTPAVQWKERRVGLALCVAGALLSLTVTVTRVLPASSGQQEHAYRAMGLWLAHQAPQETRLAATEIGIVGYYSNCYVIDLGGLVLSRGQFSRRDDPAALLGAARPNFVLMKYAVPGASYRTVMSFNVVGHNAAVMPTLRTLSLYEVKWATAALN